MTTSDYLRGSETLRRRELWYGIVREPASPNFDHQAVVTRLTVLLDPVARSQNGVICVSPLDVILDRGRALVLQPDLLFVAPDQLDIIADRIYGAPHMVIEVISPGTMRRDRGVKLRLYRKYGVRECWLVDPRTKRIACVPLGKGRLRRRGFRGGAAIESSVLGLLPFSADDVFAGR